LSKGSAWKNTPEGKTVRRNKIAEQFAWQAISMLESPAYRVMSLSALRVVARINIENAHHGGQDNGKLPVTFRDFFEYGVHWNAIAPAIREAEALGFIRVTQEGRAGNGEWRIPNMFALTHLPSKDNPKATEDWKRIKTVEEAEIIARTARKSAEKKQKTSIGKRSSASSGKRSSTPISPVSDCVSQSTTETVSLSISRAVSAQGAASEPVLPLSFKTKLVWSEPVLTEIEYTPELRRLYELVQLSASPYLVERVQRWEHMRDNRGRCHPGYKPLRGIKDEET
jgi:hypothetical protein